MVRVHYLRLRGNGDPPQRLGSRKVGALIEFYRCIPAKAGDLSSKIDFLVLLVPPLQLRRLNIGSTSRDCQKCGEIADVSSTLLR